jgi:hypothetical protein
MSSKTTLMLSTKHALIEQVASGHRKSRVSDQSVTPEGKTTIPPPTAKFDFKEVQSVSRISVDRDADGNVYINLEA